MRRRDTLRKCATLGAAGSLGLLAGCSGGGEQSESESEESAELSVKTFDYREGDSGNLVVTATVENTGDSEETGHLYVTVTAMQTTSENETDGSGDEGDGEDTDETVASRESLEVTVPAGETKTVEVPFEFTVEQFERKGSIKVDLRT
jgi:hypothetical protein